MMLPRKRTPTHPGEILSEEFLKPLGLTQVALADHLDVPVQRINELVRGKRGVTPETAWLLAGAFGTTPEFWLNLQSNHDLVRARPTRTIQQLATTG
ncbi:MAG TPA: HigA family addiction module antitoxin [Acidimicrobiia bacterium]|nr:HigA family addiction module antitoxin [Acidimicrobiia bacterium]